MEIYKDMLEKKEDDKKSAPKSDIDRLCEIK